MKTSTKNTGETSAWKYVKKAFEIRTTLPAQSHVLLVLSNHSDGKGECWPSYKQLMEETAYSSEQTIADALKYLRDKLGILTWRKGWGNNYRHVANMYKLDYSAMCRLVKKQKEETSAVGVSE